MVQELYGVNMTLANIIGKLLKNFYLLSATATNKTTGSNIK